MRLAAFIIALLLLAGSMDPTRGALIALTVVTGIAAVRPRFWSPFDLDLALDLRLASFVLAILLLAGAVDPTREWLIALSAVTGAAMIAPGALSLDGRGGARRRLRRRMHRRWRERADDWGWRWEPWR